MHDSIDPRAGSNSLSQLLSLLGTINNNSIPGLPGHKSRDLIMISLEYHTTR